MMYTWKVTVVDCGSPGPASATALFYTGPSCTEVDRRSYMEPVLLRPFDGEIIRSTTLVTVREDGSSFTAPVAKLLWDDPNSCLPPEAYTIQLSRDRTFRRRDLDAGSIQLTGPVTTTMWYPMPEADVRDCDRIYWRVLIGQDLGYDVTPPEARYAQAYAYSDTWSFVVNTGGVICPIDLGPWITPIPPDVWIPFVSRPVPTGQPPMAGIDQPANCRSGPGMDYPVLDILPQGASLEINGRNQAGSWWQVHDPNLSKECWLAGNLVEVSGDASRVPVIQAAPPEPTAADTHQPGGVNCAQFSGDQKACTDQPTCKWDPNHSPNNPCVNK